jgi:putative phosphoesterase
MAIRVGVLSDTHLHAVTEELTTIHQRHLAEADLVLHAGDVVCADVVDFLSNGDFHGVHGNMDPPEVKEGLPRKMVIQLGPYRVGLIHGWGGEAGIEERIRREFQDVDVIVYGHSHRPANHVHDGVLFFNPGTATGYSRDGIHSIGILRLGETVEGDILQV